MRCKTHHQVYNNYKLISSYVRDIEHKVTSNKVCVTHRLASQPKIFFKHFVRVNLRTQKEGFKETVVINVVTQAFEKRLCDNIDDNTTSRHENRHEMTPEKRAIFGGF